MSTESNEIVVQERDFWVMGVAFIMLVVAVGLVIVNLIVISGQANQAAETHAAACSFRSYLYGEALQADQYLKTHPNGLPSLGISASQLQQRANRETSAFEALSGLNCS